MTIRDLTSVTLWSDTDWGFTKVISVACWIIMGLYLDLSYLTDVGISSIFVWFYNTMTSEVAYGLGFAFNWKETRSERTHQGGNWVKPNLVKLCIPRRWKNLATQPVELVWHRHDTRQVLLSVCQHWEGRNISTWNIFSFSCFCPFFPFFLRPPPHNVNKN